MKYTVVAKDINCKIRIILYPLSSAHFTNNGKYGDVIFPNTPPIINTI